MPASTFATGPCTLLYDGAYPTGSASSVVSYAPIGSSTWLWAENTGTGNGHIDAYWYTGSNPSPSYGGEFVVGESPTATPRGWAWPTATTIVSINALSSNGAQTVKIWAGTQAGGCDNVGLQFTVQGRLCTQANQAQDSCSELDIGSPLPGSAVQAYSASTGGQVGSATTAEDGTYVMTVTANPGDTVRISPVIYGPAPNGQPLQDGWHPGELDYVVPPMGPVPGQVADFQYVVPEAQNADWWSVGGTWVPLITSAGPRLVDGTATADAAEAWLRTLTVAEEVPVVAPVLGAGALATIVPPVFAAATAFLVTADVLAPGDVGTTTQVRYVMDSSDPRTSPTAHTVTLAPGQETTVTVGPGGMVATSGEAVITRTIAASGTPAVASEPAPAPGPAPIAATSPTVVPQAQPAGLTCGVLDLVGCLQVAFVPQRPLEERLQQVDDTLGTKEPFAGAGATVGVVGTIFGFFADDYLTLCVPMLEDQLATQGISLARPCVTITADWSVMGFQPLQLTRAVSTVVMLWLTWIFLRSKLQDLLGVVG
jgi:hypothetical protein